jgi:hypothetical protein
LKWQKEEKKSENNENEIKYENGKVEEDEGVNNEDKDDAELLTFISLIAVFNKLIILSLTTLFLIDSGK